MFKSLLAKFKRMDWLMTACVLALIVMGTVFIWSSGSARQSASLQTIWVTHAYTAVFGLAIYFACALLDYRKLLNWLVGRSIFTNSKGVMAEEINSRNSFPSSPTDRRLPVVCKDQETSDIRA